VTLSPWGRLRFAVAERMPGWARARFGADPRALGALCLVLVVVAGFAVHRYGWDRPQSVPVAERMAPDAAAPALDPSSSTSPSSSSSSSSSAAAAETVVVDVAGEVGEPGIYTLPAGSRVADAIEAAGGGRPGVDTDGLNRARVLVDGEHIVVGGPPATVPGAGAAPGGAAAPAPVSINTATAEQLQTLPGIGPVLAGHILTRRQEIGAFTSVEQLGEVTGIGERRLADLRDRVVL
jgi:competence protein ComEA